MMQATNIINALRRIGWSEEEISDFMVFIATNKPTAEQAEEAKQHQK